MKRCFRIAVASGLCWCVLVEVVGAFAHGLFGLGVDGDWFLLIAASSWTEIREFGSVYGMWITLAVLAIVVMCGVVWGMCLLSRGWVWRCFLIVAACYVAWSCRSVACATHWGPLYLAYDTLRSANEYAELMRAGRYGEDGSEGDGAKGRGHSDASRRNLVVVIGESMTTDRMSLYGYGKRTTPCLDALREKMTVMPPVRPNFPDTVRSLRMMFTQASEARPNLAVETSAVTFRKRGYGVSFIGAQPQWGRYCGVEHMLFGACNNRIYVNENGTRPDEVLVEYLEREMAFMRDVPFVIFVQMNGSHFDPAHRVPPSFATPPEMDAYDRSVCYSDHVLGQMIARLPANTSLVFLSDHGETPDAGRWRDVTDPSLWKVPLVIYPKCEGVEPIKTLDQVYWLLLEVYEGQRSEVRGQRFMKVRGWRSEVYEGQRSEVRGL